MKDGWKLSALMLMFVAVHTPLQAQQAMKLKDVFSQDSVVWCGIDYRKAQFAGEFADKALHEYFTGWNKLFLFEPNKYDLRKTLGKKFVMMDIASVSEMNEASVPVVTSAEPMPLDKELLPTLVADYKLARREGIGVAFVADTYDRLKKECTHYVVFFDIASRTVLLSQKYTSVPDGIGVRNYWAGALYDTLRTLKSSFKKLRKKYG